MEGIPPPDNAVLLDHPAGMLFFRTLEEADPHPSLAQENWHHGTPSPLQPVAQPPSPSLDCHSPHDAFAHILLWGL
jgi:hypothetical protein